MQDRPTAAELLRAAQEFCEKDLMEATTGRVRFHVRVLQNVLAILEREWEGEDAAVRAEWERLSALLDDATDPPVGLGPLRDQVKGRNAELSARIRRGDLDDRFDETLTALRTTVADKLDIANPRWRETR
jgi:hypothetical protein